jgi:peptidoglycan/LPS O-acetylase OafA/YrhL
VIALSIGDEPVTAGYVARFIARRSLRLDPPYWVTIALTVLMLYVFNMFMRRHDTPIPHVDDVIANLTYTTGILNAKPVLPVLWTLCLEVQFYLLLVGILFADQRIGRKATKALGWPGAILFWTITAVSVLFAGQWICRGEGIWTINLGPWQATYHHWWLPSLQGWFIDMWMLFALGAVLSWTMARRMHPAWLVTYCIALGYAAWPTMNAPVLTGLGTVAAVLIAAGTGRLHHGVGGPLVRLIGTVSYSLYLMHALVGPQVLGYGAAVVGHSLWADIPLVGFAYAVCIGVAWLMHKYVERPGIEVGKRFRHKRGTIPVGSDSNAVQSAVVIGDPALVIRPG